jgi:DNA repair protein RadC
MKIHSLAKENRPRERLKEKGPEALSNAELLAIIIRTGNKNENAIDVAQKILSKYKLSGLSRKSITEISKINGVGEVKASQIIASFELARRFLSTSINEKIRINNPDDVFKQFHSRLSFLNKEHFIALYFNSRRCLIKEQLISTGSLNSAIINAREIFSHALAENAAAIILLHNHPSGDSSPSDEDIKITKELSAAAELTGIKLLDHIIIGHNNFISLKKENLL